MYMNKSYGGKKTKKNKKTACVGLSKKKCVFPCKRVKKNKNMEAYGHCRSIFSRKGVYMDAKTKKIVYKNMRKLRTTAKNADSLREKAETIKKDAKVADKSASVAENKAKGLFNIISTSLGFSPKPKSANGSKKSTIESITNKTDDASLSEPVAEEREEVSNKEVEPIIEETEEVSSNKEVEPIVEETEEVSSNKEVEPIVESPSDNSEKVEEEINTQTSISDEEDNKNDL